MACRSTHVQVPINMSATHLKLGLGFSGRVADRFRAGSSRNFLNTSEFGSFEVTPPVSGLNNLPESEKTWYFNPLPVDFRRPRK